MKRFFLSLSMKKLISFLYICALLFPLSFSIKAQNISSEFATEIAHSWINNKVQNNTNKVIFKDSLSYNNQASIFRYDLKPQGFIWVSANMQFAPVLAYSFENNFNYSDTESPAFFFLKKYQNEVVQMLSSGSLSKIQHPEWINMNSSSRLKGLKMDEAVEPMMEVTWGQGSGYNTYTPENTPTGCVAVAMIQIMRHWEWPAKGHGEHSYTHDSYGDFAINFDTIDFNWSGMPLNSPSTEIAKTMLYAGIALHMNYAPDGSGANTERAKNLLYSNFRYSENKIRYISLAGFGNAKNWIRVVKNDLINGRPIIYRGQGTGGHAFNFDGFDGDYFHVNWGWSGSSNGYFLVSSLTPGSNNFSEAQGAIMGIHPDTMMMWDRPYGLRALASDAKVSLLWSGVYDAQFQQYNIYRNGELIGNSKQRNYSDTAAINGEVYQYSISTLFRTDTADYESVLTQEISVEPSEGFALPYEQDFEDGFPGWDISETPRGFNYGTAAELGMGQDTISKFIGINSGIAGNNVLVSDMMISNGLDFSESSLVKLSFDYILKRWQDIDHLYLKYRIFEDDEWIEFAEIEPSGSYNKWVEFKTYLPEGALKENVQLAFFYTDNAGVGYGAGIDNIKIITVLNPGQPNFSVSETVICMGSEVIVTDQSEGSRDSYYWDFGSGAKPRYADTEGPHTVIYNSGGSKSICLILNDLDELIKENEINIIRPSMAKFNKAINYKTVSFTNTSTNADAYLWDFGDGVKVSQKNPVHAYSLSGDYRVKLIAINFTCGNDTTEQLISIKITGINNMSDKDCITIYPNPAHDILNLGIESSPGGIINSSVYNLSGRLLMRKDYESGIGLQNIQLDISDLAPGSYFIKITQANTTSTQRFIKLH